ncbi:site-specific DNA-methyltransferase [Clostridium sp. KNHs216]|uniref:DNA-methyltransferase n=1 Tax=Clostridium sp. KNHs216 TaxID=1550235 RepID=UPI0011516B98|nr:site-specific DNA-methyltransferase [Clostridium sp. KNHs216]TQI66765.1 site-specific DNA-methyltransferase (adenine-specific) [Clostridium sp. KNHs216]
MDCIAGMSMYPDHSIDMILCDLPYGMTGCRWDSLIPFPELWRQYDRVIKDDGAIVLTSCQPFTRKLISSNPKMFKYCWYWYKNRATGFANAKKQRLRCVEEICVFYKHQPTYNPQGIIALDKPIKHHGKSIPQHGDSVYRMDGSLSHDTETCIIHYPRQLFKVKCERGLHPTQKPVALFEYIIRTYANSGELVLDNCMGSGTTAAACTRSGRNFTGFEMDEHHYKATIHRIRNL